MRFQLDDLEIDLSRQSVIRDGEALDVKGLSFQLLAFLLQQGQRVVSYDALIEAVWAPAVVNEETVTQRVRLLRTALGDDGRKPRYIRSVRGQGYQLCQMPRVVVDTGVAGVRPSRGSRFLVLAAGIAAVAIVSWMMAQEDLPAAAEPPDETSRLLERAAYYAGVGQAQSNTLAISLYEKILERDPDNVSAMLGLAFALSASTCQFDASPESAERAARLSRDVLADNANNARAHTSLAYAADCLGLIDDAIASYERAVALDPQGRRDSAASVAHLYAITGRLADALRLNVHALDASEELRFVDLQMAHVLGLLGFEVAAEQRYAETFRLYPDNVFVNAAYPLFLFGQGRISEARSIVQQAVQRPARPELLVLAGELALLDGDRDAARKNFEAAAALREHMGLPGTLARLYGDGADQQWIQQRIDTVQTGIDRGDRWPNNWLELALLHAHAGNIDAAFTALEHAIDHGYRDAAYLHTSPLFAGLRNAPAFVPLIDRITTAVSAEREKVLAAEWLPAPVLSATR